MTANHNVDAASFCPSTSSGPSPICCVSGSPRRSCQPGSDGTEDVGAGAHQADIDPRQPVTASRRRAAATLRRRRNLRP